MWKDGQVHEEFMKITSEILFPICQTGKNLEVG